jgi:hypothetical protein
MMSFSCSSNKVRRMSWKRRKRTRRNGRGFERWKRSSKSSFLVMARESGDIFFDDNITLWDTICFIVMVNQVTICCFII